MPETRLNIGIVGAGIAGLSAAVALLRVDHNVELYEKSHFRNETGNAIVIGVNGTRILSEWGFDFSKASPLDLNYLRRYNAITAELEEEVTFSGIQEQYGDRWLLFHRADLHSGLRDLVERYPGQVLHLGNPVVDIDVEKGTIKLADGDEVHKDLILVADGSHSRLVDKIIGQPHPPRKTPVSLYRFLQPLDKILAYEQIKKFYSGSGSGFTSFYTAAINHPAIILNSYPCRGGELLYVALLHRTKAKEEDIEGWESPASPKDIMADAQASGLHPTIQAICENAMDAKVYTQLWREAAPNFSRGKAIVLGDAVHLMLPTHGQGASQALESAMALEIIYKSLQSAADVSQKAQLFDQLRLPRVSAIQIMSNKFLGSPGKMLSEIRRVFDGEVPSPDARTYSKEYNDFFFRYDIKKEAQKIVG